MGSFSLNCLQVQFFWPIQVKKGNKGRGEIIEIREKDNLSIYPCPLPFLHFSE